MLHIPTIRAYTQGIEILRQKNLVSALFDDMEEVWLSLMTPDKRSIILEQIGTNQKRRLVRQYVIELIKRTRATIGFDLSSKVIDPDNAFWPADDIALRVADSVVESHYSMFRSLMNAIFGISIRIIDFMFKEHPTREDLYALLSDFYNLEVDDNDQSEEVSLEWLTERLNEYVEEPSLAVFSVSEF